MNFKTGAFVLSSIETKFLSNQHFETKCAIEEASLHAEYTWTLRTKYKSQLVMIYFFIVIYFVKFTVYL